MPPTTTISGDSDLSDEKRDFRPTLWFGGAVLLGYWAVTVHRLGGLWSALPEYSYGWIVPLLCLVLFLDRWGTRPRDLRPRGRRPIAGWLLFFFAGLFVFSRLAMEINPMWRFMAWGLAVSTLGLTLCGLSLALGGKFMRHFFFPVAFFLLAVPWHTRIEVPFIQFLTALNAGLTVELLAFFKVTAVRMGNLILIEPGMVGVQEACSGIRSFQSTLMVSLFLGELFRFSFWRRVVFVLLGASLSFVFNIVRTSFLVWTCNREGLSAVDKFHDPAGWSILAASIASLALIGWWLYRGQKKRTESPATTKGAETGARVSRAADSSIPGRDSRLAGAQWLAPAAAFLLALLVLTEFGIHSWFAAHERVRHASVDWALNSDVGSTTSKSLVISKEVRALLDYDLATGWEWQGGGAERWQAFSFVWQKPNSLSRRIAVMAGALGHQPELCFTRAGMQLRQNYGKRRYTANNVPLVFKVYEFSDRNTPIFVFSSVWERNQDLLTADEMQSEGVNFSQEGVAGVFKRLSRADRGITDEVRVFKLGVWGPRTIDEADAAFQQQLNLLVHPKTSGASG